MYFKVFQTNFWRKRTVRIRRRNCAVLPKIYFHNAAVLYSKIPFLLPLRYGRFFRQLAASRKSLLLGEEPTYRVITNGRWRSNAPYGTIHRVASDGSVRGIAQACFDFCKQHCDYLRIDTHADNLPMQNAIEKAGFHRCSMVAMEDGSPRIAYDLIPR